MQLGERTGTQDDLIDYINENNIDISVINGTNIEVALISNKTYIIEKCGREDQNNNITYLKYKKSNSLFQLDTDTLSIAREVKDSEGKTVISDTINELSKIEDIISRAKSKGDLSFENIQASNIDINNINISEAGGQALLIDNSNSLYKIKFLIRGATDDEVMLNDSDDAIGLQDSDNAVASITFNNSNVNNNYTIYSNGKIDAIRDVSMDEE